MKSTDLVQTHQRQIHLDFHTSPFIPDVGREFNADAFAETFHRAHVNSVTIFAKCHHGMCYYPTKVGVQHPALKGRDLLGEMIEALHARGIRCPIYVTVGWEEHAADQHPEWRQMHHNGTFAQLELSPDWKNFQPGRWRFMNWLHPEYQDTIEAHLLELLKGYSIDGFFFDILGFHRDACWSESCLAFRRRHGLLSHDPETQARFNGMAQAAFLRRFSRLIRGHRPKATIYYNAAHHLMLGDGLGGDAWLREQSHVEIESLPSGFWGYQHFQRLARFVSQTGKPWIAQTGRFQKMWGDFGGIKPQAALEYECFRAQALGGGNSVGDQLPPRGRLDPAAYELIGVVYAQCEAAEPFYKGSVSLHQVGIVSPGYPGRDPERTDKALEGAVQMCEEAHYDAAVLNDKSDLSKYDLVILPDQVVATPALVKRLRAYYQGGGNLMISYRSGFDASGLWALDFLPLTHQGENEKFPAYWRARRSFLPDMSRSDRVFYQQGLNVLGGKGTQVLVDRVLPYFKRTDLKFSSHFQTPPVARPDRFPAVIAGERFVYCADPEFSEYRQSGNLAVRDVWKQCMERLVGLPPFGAGLPTTVLCVPRRRGNDLLVTLLHYVPTRKALDIDIIEERMSFAGEIFHLAQARPSAFVTEPDGSLTPLENVGVGAFALPPVKGRVLLSIPDFFN